MALPPDPRRFHEMQAIEKRTDIPPAEQTLQRLTLWIRALGWVWSVALVLFSAGGERAVLIGAIALSTIGMLGLYWAVKRGVWGTTWYALLDGLVTLALLAAGWLAQAPDFIAGGYPMSWLFVAAFAWRLRGALIASLFLTAWMAVLHVLMELDLIRTVGSIQFIVVAVIVGMTFDAVREREALRLQAESELAAQQDAATRLEERTEIARELHDSVLQTMKLISAAADDPSEVRYLARIQERGLRKTINEYQSPHSDSFRVRLLEARAEVEDSCRVKIEQVIRHDAEMTPGLFALVEAAKEAMTNAARHSGSPTIDLFAEIRNGGIQVNIRDRGKGFDPAAVGIGGIAQSIRERMRKAGGYVDINSEPGKGTDVTLFLPYG